VIASSQLSGESERVKISIIVPAFNEEKRLPETLRAIVLAQAAFHARQWTTELIVCDNNSTDATAAVARAGGALVVFERFNQIARARNTGAAAATGDWLLFIDADSLPTPELFADVAEAIARGDCLAGGSTVSMGREAARLIRLACHLWNRLSVWRRWLAGSFIFCETATFRALGGFNQELFASEEIDLSLRLHRPAAAQGKQVVILTAHPLLTSDRRAQLYTLREQLVFGARVISRFGRPLRSREVCRQWYDGRR
jgi:glycosyltransferase involved in cell wall biosynthesis